MYERVYLWGTSSGLGDSDKSSWSPEVGWAYIDESNEDISLIPGDLEADLTTITFLTYTLSTITTSSITDTVTSRVLTDDYFAYYDYTAVWYYTSNQLTTYSKNEIADDVIIVINEPPVPSGVMTAILPTFFSCSFNDGPSECDEIRTSKITDTEDNTPIQVTIECVS